MNSKTLHLNNTKLILQLVKKAGQISRSELAKQTRLTPPTISKIVDSLAVKHGLLEYAGPGSSNGGRPSVVVQFRTEGNYIIGIDLGATYIRACMVDLDANCISEIQLPTELENGFRHVIEKVLQIIHRFQQRQEAGTKIWGVGIGVAGLVNKQTGIIESSPDFGWSEIDFQREISKNIDLPLFYDNSTRLMALGELNFGKHPDLKNFSIINVGYGIAAGIVIDGNLVSGQKGFAGEFGHIPLDPGSSVSCKCGMPGCLEAMASGHRIAELGKLVMKNNESKVLYSLTGGNQNLVTAEIVGKAAQQGDIKSIDIYENITEYLSQGIGMLINLLNPEAIFLGGGISLNGKFFFDMINNKVPRYLLPPNDGVQIIPSTFGEQATSIGAVSLVMDKILNLELK